MATLAQHLESIARAEHNVDEVSAARQKLIDELEQDPAANDAVTEAMYRLGLFTLVNKKDLNAGSELFKRAAERKNPTWSPLARTSFALTQQARGKHQQAVFELRKVIGTGAPSPATATALIFLCTILRDARAKPSEIEKADKERITHLAQFVSTLPDKGEDSAHWRLMLAQAHKEGGTRSEAKKHLEAVVAMDKAAGDQNIQMARELLKGM